MCDCDAPACWTEQYPVARKEHRCCECGGTIKPGEKYKLFSGVWNGRGASYKTCMTCQAVRKEWIARLSPGDCGPCFGDLWSEVTDYGNEPREPWLELVNQGHAASQNC